MGRLAHINDSCITVTHPETIYVNKTGSLHVIIFR